MPAFTAEQLAAAAAAGGFALPGVNGAAAAPGPSRAPRAVRCGPCIGSCVSAWQHAMGMQGPHGSVSAGPLLRPGRLGCRG